MVNRSQRHLREFQGYDSAGESDKPAVPNWMSADMTAGALPSWLTLNRPSLAMMFDSAGKLTYPPNNICPWSQDFTNALWTKTAVTTIFGIDDPNKGTTACRMTATAVNGTIQKTVTSGFGINNGISTMVNSIWVRRVFGTGQVRLYTPSQSSVFITPTSSWARYSAASAPGVTGFALGVQLANAGDIVDIAFAQGEVVTYQTVPTPYQPTTATLAYGARFDYDPATLAPKGLLIEPVLATNYLLVTEAIAGGANWTFTNASISKQALGLYGGVSLYTLTQTAGLTGTYTTSVNGISAVVGTLATATVALLAGNLTSTYIGILGSTTIWGGATETKATVVSGPGTVVQNTGSLWQVNGLSATVPTVVALVRTATAIETFTLTIRLQIAALGAANDNIKFGMTQLEIGAVHSAYIPTGTAAVTRAADVLSFDSALTPILNALNFSFFCTLQLVPVLLGAGVQNPPSLFGVGGSLPLQFYIQNANDTPVNLIGYAYPSIASSIDAGVNFKIGGRMGIAHKGVRAAMTREGRTLVIQPAATVGLTTQPTSWQVIRTIPTWLKDVALYKYTVTDAKLQALSVAGVPYDE